MHIGVDATCWLLGRGFGRHARCLLTALRQIDQNNRYTFFTDTLAAVPALEALGTVRLVKTTKPTLVGAASGSVRSPWDLLSMSRALSDPEIALLFFPTSYSFVPVFSRARKLLMIHDIMPERYPELTIGDPRSVLLWKTKSWIARRQADAIATVSNYSKDALVSWFGLEPKNVHVVGEASDAAFRRLDEPAPTANLVRLGIASLQRSVVWVGGFSPQKNVPLLVDAFAQIAGQADFADVTLVLVGDYERDTFRSAYREVRDRVDALGLSSRVVLTGFLPDADVVVLLNRATVLAIPSLMEGFGLPAIEAAACGCPVIATKESPLPELLGEGGVYIDPEKPEELVSALRLVLDSPEKQASMRRAGMAAAARLTWDAAARDLLTLMEQTVRG